MDNVLGFFVQTNLSLQLLLFLAFLVLKKGRNGFVVKKMFKIKKIRNSASCIHFFFVAVEVRRETCMSFKVKQ